eukprot:s558_g16.t1
MPPAAPELKFCGADLGSKTKNHDIEIWLVAKWYRITFASRLLWSLAPHVCRRRTFFELKERLIWTKAPMEVDPGLVKLVGVIADRRT